MGRYIGSVCRLCRREGAKLYLKGQRCFGEKCAIERRNYAPGQHGQGRPRLSEYQTQLREKQKLKRIYGLLERQFRVFYSKAVRKKGITGENLLQLLERRLDNVIYKLSLAGSRSEARQFIIHGHYLVNGRKVNIPAYVTKMGDVIEVKPSSQQLVRIQAVLSTAEGKLIPAWLELEKGEYKGKVKGLPTREDIALPVNEQLVVELYSR